MATYNASIVPPSGFHYIDGDVRLQGYSYLNLIKVVENYRAENNLPSGDVRGDIDTYLCGNWPHNCHGTESVIHVSVTPQTATTELLSDIQTWAKNMLHSNVKLDLVSDEIAEKRSKTCLDCPQNVNWRAGCGSCIVATDRISASIRQGRDTPSSQVLGGCRIMRHDNRSAIFFDKDVLQKSGNIPNNCWLNE